jgi:integrase
MISAALRRAVKWRLVPENVAAQAEPPSPGKSPARAPSREQLANYLAVIRPTPHWCLILLTLATGLRRGEVLGLAWDAIDLDRLVLEVRQTVCEAGPRYWIRPRPKTAAGWRQVAFPAALGDELHRWRAQQDEEKKVFGTSWRSDLNLVFPAPASGGLPWKPQRLSHALRPLARAAGLPLECRPLHGLRHHHATRLLAEGIAMKVASERLGHASIVITANLYTHVEATLDRAAADAIGRGLEPLLENLAPATTPEPHSGFGRPVAAPPAEGRSANVLQFPDNAPPFRGQKT